ncbi:hypothetical protein ABK040_002799 [Willaertia magna]
MKVFIGPYITAQESVHEPLIYCKKGFILVNDEGYIHKVFEKEEDFNKEVKIGDDWEVIQLKENQFLTTGFIDVHTHAPQYYNCGLGIGMPLLDWLHTYTFPTEKRFANVDFADKVYRKCVQKSVCNGSTTCVYFATIHKESSLQLARITKEFGQRAFIGKVNMDRMSPNDYIEDTEESIKDTIEFIERMNSEIICEETKKHSLLTPIITPRFVVSCSSELMRRLGEIAKQYNLPIQSHISENEGEVDLVKELHQEHDHYADVYEQHGLLTENTVMAHGIYLNDEEIKLFKERKSSVIHCPLSNFTLLSGVLNVRKLIKNGVNVCLGTDVSGGYSISMLSCIKTTLIASSMTHDVEHPPLTVDEIFFMGTQAGAIALGLKDKVGTLREGKSFDALIVDLNTHNSPIDPFHDDTTVDEEQNLKNSLQRFLLNGDDRNITQVFVQGKLVHSHQSKQSELF